MSGFRPPVYYSQFINSDMKNIRFFIIMVALFAAFLYGCKKEEEPVPVNPYNGRTFAIFNPDKSYGTLTDIDGNIYKTITIGTQTWMAENLRTTRYRNGDPIPQIKPDEDWPGLIAGGYCNFNNTENVDTIATFGRLYNWLAVNDSRNLAPLGWHIPTDEEWTTLTNFLGGDSVAGGKMKEKEQPHWVNPDPNATNESGFTALPAGMRDNSSGAFSVNCTFWSSTEVDNCSAWCRFLYVGQDGCIRYNPGKTYGFSIRCIKD
ncbi:MAG: hypothetical protein EOM90_09195 [Alphaproteobacteria bacterium]|nr:hypothetical protein [Alphaproteobacteria bacterium]